ncbi:hypothetical protein GGU10DRAFT_299274 [Lentinula aff. detonsa]|uniref:Uncharacterized protein n=1 Tax=Lentinula aff. detonsa TaxID=2804958 RepID=A0AA38NHS0_9AGAR|nr:hypothetical protein GGU10DRAFT_299274 [Lentinula aff. detonsa]
MFLPILRTIWVLWSIFSSTYLCLKWLTKLDRFRGAFADQKQRPDRTKVQEQRAGLLPLTASNLILRELSPLDRHRYSLANKEAYDAVCSFNRQAYRIEHILSPYFNEDEVNAFRLVQLKTDTLISGSSALQFFDLSVFADSDLDLYIVRDWDKVTLVAGFLTSAGYDYAPSADQPQSFQQAFEVGRSPGDDDYSSDEGYTSSIWGVYSFIRGSDKKKIQIITCEKNIIQVILGFHLTCVMNIISYSHAYALYPYATFIEKCAVENGGLHTGASLLRALNKYRGRGWHTSPVPSKTNALRSWSEFRDTARSVGDSACWVIPLAPVQHAYPAQDFDNTPSAVDSLRVNSWYTIVTVNGWTRFGFSEMELRHQNWQVYPFTFAAIPWAWKRTLGPAADHLGENETVFKSQSSIEDLVKLTRTTFDGEPDEIHEHVRKLVSQACDAMPSFINLGGERLGPSVYSIITLVRQLDIIFSTFRENPSCSVTFRIDARGQIWTWVELTLPTNHTRRLYPSLKMFLGDPMLKHLTEQNVCIELRRGIHLLESSSTSSRFI